jgi:hypothetical protein
MTSLNLEDNKMETPTGYRRWLISIALSLCAVGGTILTAVSGFGGQSAQLQQNTKDIERLQQRESQFATKTDIEEVKQKIDRLDDRLFQDKKRTER